VPESKWQHRLQVCKVNRLAIDHEVVDQLRQLDCQVQLEECLDECSRCERIAFALVDGRIRTAATARGLAESIVRSTYISHRERTVGRNRGAEPGKR